MEFRTESDSMGQMKVPATALYGASTARAVENFPISELRFSRRFLMALGLIKQSAAKANAKLGLLPQEIADAIVQAAQELIEGELDSHFVVDIFQTGSGTSTNMNANEVLSNRASQILGAEIGSKKVHPNDHVNMGQSSNDVIPTAMHLSALLGLVEHLKPALNHLEQALAKKAAELKNIVKTGRTHLQDATPIRFDQVFEGFRGQILQGLKRLEFAVTEMSSLPIGGTAVGTGVNTHPEFSHHVCSYLSNSCGLEIKETSNHFQAQNNVDAMISAHGVLRTIAVSLYKIANDLRWMASGPRAGLGELKLPEVQPGSSIMPGKVNPVIAESVLQVVAHVLGNDQAIVHSCYGSYFELNTMFPVVAYNFNESVNLLTSATVNFVDTCIEGLEATSQGPDSVERGLMLATALAPVVGYDLAAKIAKQASLEGTTIRQVALTMTELSEKELDEILNPLAMTTPLQASSV